MSPLFSLKKSILFLTLAILFSGSSLQAAYSSLKDIEAELDAIADADKKLGYVIIFCGGSSVGKSTIVDKFLQLSQGRGQSYISIGIDAYSDKKVKKAKLSSPLCGRKIGWCGEHALSYERMRELVSGGERVLCDTILLTDDGRNITDSFIQTIKSAVKCGVYSVFVHCPLGMILENFEKRTNKRDLFSVLSNFTSLYKLKPQGKDKDDDDVFELSLDDVRAACAKIMSQTDLKDSKKQYAIADLMRRFGLTSDSKEKSVLICPSYDSYNYIFENDGEGVLADKLNDLFVWTQKQLKQSEAHVDQKVSSEKSCSSSNCVDFDDDDFDDDGDNNDFTDDEK